MHCGYNHPHTCCMFCVNLLVYMVTKSAAAKIMVGGTAQASGITVTLNTYREMLVMTFVDLKIVNVHIMCHVVYDDACL